MNLCLLEYRLNRSRAVPDVLVILICGPIVVWEVRGPVPNLSNYLTAPVAKLTIFSARNRCLAEKLSSVA